MPSELRLRSLSLLAALAVISSFGCGKSEGQKTSAAPNVVQVTVAQAQSKALEIVEETIGSLESVIDPTISAEVSGKVVKVNARAGDDVKAGQVVAVLDAQDFALTGDANRAEIARLEALATNQRKVVERNRRLRESGFISHHALDDSASQLKAQEQQIAAARAQYSLTQRSVQKTQIVSPVDARVETQVVSPGDFVKVGDPLFKIVSTRRLRANLPFPETVASLLKPGLKVKLSTPTAPNDVIEGEIEALKPMTGASNRAVEAIARVDNPGAWKPGSSVNAAVVVATRGSAVMVPEQSVVLRPAGKVVYVIANNQATQKIVETGIKQGGFIEITAGVKDGETVAADGAAFLTDGAAVNVKAAS